jgi:hypothetical protein
MIYEPVTTQFSLAISKLTRGYSLIISGVSHETSFVDNFCVTVKTSITAEFGVTSESVFVVELFIASESVFTSDVLQQTSISELIYMLVTISLYDCVICGTLECEHMYS